MRCPDCDNEDCEKQPSPPKQNEKFFYMTAANGMIARIPESQLENWKKAQDELRKNPDAHKEEIQRTVAALKERFAEEKESSQPQPRPLRICLADQHTVTCSHCLQKITGEKAWQYERYEKELKEAKEQREQAAIKLTAVNMAVAATIAIGCIMGSITATGALFDALNGVLFSYFFVGLYWALSHGTQEASFWWCIPAGILAFICTMGANSMM